VLVVSNGGDRTSPSARACGQSRDLEVICLTPPSSSTRGEARGFAALAHRERWRSVVVVTSTYHLRRARQALRRCYDGVVAAAAVAPADHLWDLPRHVAREWAGLLVTSTAQRGC
jgi:uncharacterized SAM-binding protein YcdF (DUF218 family)